MRHSRTLTSALAACTLVAGCADDPTSPQPRDPDMAPVVAVDRFSDDAATLFRRSANPALPGANEPIDFDEAPFITQGLGPNGEVVRYYNFDVQPTTPAPIYVLFREGESAPVSGQLNIVGVIPGDDGYNDFWRVMRVTVPADYVANTITSADAVLAGDFTITPTTTIVNCPIVPEGSSADLRFDGGSAQLIRGWYEDEVVHYFSFEENLTATAGNTVPLSPIYVAFNINPGEAGGGPASGFVMEAGSPQTHNVVATVPGDTGYSPFWSVNVYDNADFDAVSDLSSALQATILGMGVATPNCPVVDAG